MMRWAALISKFSSDRRPSRSRPDAGRRRPLCEALETRDLLSGLGSDYTLMGGQWDDTRTITYSIAPDGVSWDQGVNNINATLNAKFGGPGWQRLVAQALQTWGAATNLNFVQVGDGNDAFNTPGLGQGDPRFGDIRIGGYNLGTNATIARTYGPPPNGQTGAGDVELNTGFSFAPGTHYDLETVLLHELGHALGLGESPQPSSAMYTFYEGSRQSLSPYDVEGIQSIYGVKQADTYQSQGRATSATTAVDLTPMLNPAGQIQMGGLDLSRFGDVEYFSVLSPERTGSTLNVAAIARGFSMMSPKVSLVDASTGAILAVDAHPDQVGNYAFDSTIGILPNHRYLIEATGATTDAFSVGSYGLAVGFFGGTAVVPAPDAYAYNNNMGTATDLGTNTQPTIGNLTLPSGSDLQVFTFAATNPGRIVVGAVGARVLITNASGQVFLGGTGVLAFNQVRGSRYYLIIQSLDGNPVFNYTLAVRTP